MARADVDLHITRDHQDLGEGGQPEEPVVRWYQASEMLPEKKGPLEQLLKKQPAVLGSLQVVSGLFSVGVGIIFVMTQELPRSLCALFRVSYLSGIIVLLVLNVGCVLLAVVAAALIIADVALWDPDNAAHLQVEVVELTVLLAGAALSVVLCRWFSRAALTSGRP